MIEATVDKGLWIKENAGALGLCIPSAERGLNSTAQKAQYHHDQSGLIIAMRRGDSTLIAEVMSTRRSARTR
jgi:hypothetical protein